MKNLYDYIQEGILDISNIDNMDKDIEYNQIRKWLDNNVNLKTTTELKIHEDNTISFYNLVISDNDDIIEIPDFIRYNKKMMNLQGGDIVIRNCKNFRSLGKLYANPYYITIENCNNFEDFDDCTQLLSIVERCSVSNCNKFTLKGFPDTKRLRLTDCQNIKDVKDLRNRDIESIHLDKLYNLKNIDDISWNCNELAIRGCIKLTTINRLPENINCINIISTQPILKDLLVNSKVSKELRYKIKNERDFRFVYNNENVKKSTVCDCITHGGNIICTFDGKLKE